ncbi:uncharacterized protein [Palaemon carinicauda]|uniref:uncharacterized protein n=1 Tax=Palaemon carinicauda TaxID=392227 RepID=UPI0035B57295
MQAQLSDLMRECRAESVAPPPPPALLPPAPAQPVLNPPALAPPSRSTICQAYDVEPLSEFAVPSVVQPQPSLSQPSVWDQEDYSTLPPPPLAAPPVVQLSVEPRPRLAPLIPQEQELTAPPSSSAQQAHSLGSTSFARSQPPPPMRLPSASSVVQPLQSEPQLLDEVSTVIVPARSDSAVQHSYPISSPHSGDEVSDDEEAHLDPSSDWVRYGTKKKKSSKRSPRKISVVSSLPSASDRSDEASASPSPSQRRGQEASSVVDSQGVLPREPSAREEPRAGPSRANEGSGSASGESGLVVGDHASSEDPVWGSVVVSESPPPSWAELTHRRSPARQRSPDRQRSPVRQRSPNDRHPTVRQRSPEDSEHPAVPVVHPASHRSPERSRSPARQSAPALPVPDTCPRSPA